MLHPQPQLSRERWYDLCGSWRFAFDDNDRGLREHWYDSAADAFDRDIEVLFPPESKLSGVDDRSHHPVVWYARGFDSSFLRADGRLLVHFGAVDYRAMVWVDGRYVGEHEGGHTPFAFDLTDLLEPSRREHSLVVRAVDDPVDTGQPRGKQTWRPEPHGIWYDRTTGIWQAVWLEPVPACHVVELCWTPDVAADRVDLEVSLNRAPAGPSLLDVRLSIGGEVLAEQTVRIDEASARCGIGIPALRRQRDRLMWSPESPTLIDAELVLRSDGAKSADGADRVRSYLGLATSGFRDGLFLLNGRPYYLRLVLEQGFWPESHLATPSAEALRREVELVKELGFTGVRVHQKVEDPRFLYWCDRLGLLVWGEMANAHEFSTTAATRLVDEWLDVVRRDRGHPCVVAWVPLNESWGVPQIAGSEQQRHYATALYHLTKAVDPTRPVISNDGWEHTRSDIWSVHDYTPDGNSIRDRYGDDASVHRTLFEAGPGRRKVLLDGVRRRGEPVVISEFGGLSYVPGAGQRWFGYATVESPDELRARLDELVGAILESPFVAGFCYTQLTDTQQEKNGLLTEDRQPKLPVEVIREIVSRPSKAIPSEVVDAYRRRARAASGERR